MKVRKASKTLPERLSVTKRLLEIVSRWPSDAAREWALKEIPALCEVQNVCAVVVFGSAVRDIQNISDLDVLYIYTGSPPKLSYPPMDVDLRKYSKFEVEKQLEAGNDLLSWCVKFGQPVCDAEHYWSDLVGRWLSRVNLPSEAVALERARKSEKLLRNLAKLGDDDAALEQYITMLTHLARARLIRQDVYPASRPELPSQLTKIGEVELARFLSDAIRERNIRTHAIEDHPKRIWQDFLATFASIDEAPGADNISRQASGVYPK